MKRLLLGIWRLAGAGFIAAGIFVVFNGPGLGINDAVTPAILTTPIPETAPPLIET